MIAFVLLLSALCLVGYALITKYSSTDPSQGVPKRVWTSVVAAAGAVGAALVQWIHGITGP